MTNSISATHSIELFKLTPPDDDGAAARVRAEMRLLITRSDFDEALTEGKRRADEIAFSRDAETVSRSEHADRKTTQATRPIGRLLKLEPDFRPALTNTMQPLLDLAMAARDDQQVTQSGMPDGAGSEAAAGIDASTAGAAPAATATATTAAAV